VSTHVEHVMGMAVSIDVRGDVDAEGLIDVVDDWLHRVDATFSTYKPDSAISRLDRGELALDAAPPEVLDVLERCEQLRALTEGYFDARACGRLDPSGFVKGWAVDAASAILLAGGAADHCVNAGGDVRTRGEPQPGRLWQVGIAHPLVRDALCAVLSLGDGAVATSGTAERGAHVFDPHTGRASLDLASVTILGPDLATADAFATGALARGLRAPAWLSDLDGYEALVVDAGGHVWSTPGLAASVSVGVRSD
jgi:FAD:protein FMN transferase